MAAASFTNRNFIIRSVLITAALQLLSRNMGGLICTPSCGLFHDVRE